MKLTPLRCSPWVHSCSSNRAVRRWPPPGSTRDAPTCTRSVSCARPSSPCPPSSGAYRIPAAASPSLRLSWPSPQSGHWSPRSWTGTGSEPVACWRFPSPATDLRPRPGRRCVSRPHNSWDTCNAEKDHLNMIHWVVGLNLKHSLYVILDYFQRSYRSVVRQQVIDNCIQTRHIGWVSSFHDHWAALIRFILHKTVFKLHCDSQTMALRDSIVSLFTARRSLAYDLIRIA